MKKLTYLLLSLLFLSGCTASRWITLPDAEELKRSGRTNEQPFDNTSDLKPVQTSHPKTSYRRLPVVTSTSADKKPGQVTQQTTCGTKSASPIDDHLKNKKAVVAFYIALALTGLFILSIAFGWSIFIIVAVLGLAPMILAKIALKDFKGDNSYLNKWQAKVAITLGVMLIGCAILFGIAFLLFFNS